MSNILCTTSSFGKSAPNVIDVLKDRGLQPVLNPFNRKLTETELQHLCEQYHPTGLLAGTESITRSILNSTKDYLKVISRVGVGWDNVDGAAAEEFGIQVYRTEGVLNHAVAELTIGLILSALRKIPQQDHEIRQGVWKKQMGNLLQDKIVGIIGYGAIGQQVGKLLSAFETKLLYYDPVIKESQSGKSVTLPELYKQSDIITIHASGSGQILGKKDINTLCKKGVIIVNMARGGLIDENALHEALLSGQVAFACLDVFEKEPYTGPLINLENVILTPHVGSYAKEARIRMEEMAVENLIKALDSL